jgi:hypothetical protein
MRSGEKYEMVAITNDYLDDWTYDIKIVSDSIYQQESGLTQMKMEEKLRVMGTYFPQIMMMNQEKLAKDTIISFDDEPDEYLFQPPQEEGGVLPEEEQGAEMATAGQSGLPPLPPV